MSLINILINLGNFALAINAICYFKSYRKNSVAFRVFTFYLLFSVIIQGVYFILYTLKIENLFISHYYFIGQFILLSLFFQKTLNTTLKKKLISITLLIVLISLTFYYFIFPLEYYKFNIFEIIITSTPLMVYCFLFFIQRIEGKNNNFNYLISGFFIYLLCSTLLFTTGNITSDIKKVIWYTNVILYIVYQVLIFVEWYKNFRKPQIPQVEPHD